MKREFKGTQEAEKAEFDERQILELIVVRV